MTEDGIHIHVTAKEKIMFVARKDGQSISFTMDVEQAKQFRDSFQSSLSVVDPVEKQNNAPILGENDG